jgi:hypothetical protein
VRPSIVVLKTTRFPDSIDGHLFITFGTTWSINMTRKTYLVTLTHVVSIVPAGRFQLLRTAGSFSTKGNMPSFPSNQEPSGNTQYSWSSYACQKHDLGRESLALAVTFWGRFVGGQVVLFVLETKIKPLFIDVDELFHVNHCHIWLDEPHGKCKTRILVGIG